MIMEKRFHTNTLPNSYKPNLLKGDNKYDTTKNVAKPPDKTCSLTFLVMTENGKNC